MESPDSSSNSVSCRSTHICTDEASSSIQSEQNWSIAEEKKSNVVIPALTFNHTSDAPWEDNLEKALGSVSAETDAGAKENGVAVIMRKHRGRKLNNNDLCDTSSLRFSKYLNSGLVRGTASTLRRSLIFRGSKSNLTPQDNGAKKYEILVNRRPPAIAEMKHSLRKTRSSTTCFNYTKNNMLTIQDIYVEVLYTILHMIGCDVINQDIDILMEHLRCAFDFDESNHIYLLNVARSREEPYLMANIHIEEAKDLSRKDMTGNSNPFCTLYLSTDLKTTYNTNFMQKTTSPVWDEDFVLDVNNVKNDKVHIDVWNFCMNEKVGDKLRKLGEIKDSRCFRKFIAETLHASRGKEARHNLIGGMEIPLRDVCANGISQWFQLVKPESKTIRNRGKIFVTLTLSREKELDVTKQEYFHLYQILFLYEIENCLKDNHPYAWNGALCPLAGKILNQHVIHGHLTAWDTAVSQWRVLTQIHVSHPMSFETFIPILHVVYDGLRLDKYSDDEKWAFHLASLPFIQDNIEYIKNQLQLFQMDANHKIQFCLLLRLLNLICKIQGLEEIKDENVVKNLLDKDGLKIKPQIIKAITISLQIKYKDIISKFSKSNNDEFEQTKKISDFIIIELMGNVFVYDKEIHEVFYDQFNIDYRHMAYQECCIQLSDFMKLFMSNLESTYTAFKYDYHSIQDPRFENLRELGTNILLAFNSLQIFMRKGIEVFDNGRFFPSTINLECVPECLRDYCNWFLPLVITWMKNNLFQFLNTIRNSVELEDFKPTSLDKLCSNSAIDFYSTFKTASETWQCLKWPEPVTTFAIIAKLIDDIQIVANVYADDIYERAELCSKELLNQPPTTSASSPLTRVTQIFNSDLCHMVTPSICVAANDVQRITNNLQEFLSELQIEEVLRNVTKFEPHVKQCRITLESLINNITEELLSKNRQNLQAYIVNKMTFWIWRYMREFQQLGIDHRLDLEKSNLIQYLDNNLSVLKKNLDPKIFDYILFEIWQEVNRCVLHITETNILRKKLPVSFKGMSNMLNVLGNLFYNNKAPSCALSLKVLNLLSVYSMDTTNLIGEYLKLRHKSQSNVAPSDGLGTITVKCLVSSQHVAVLVLSAKNLVRPYSHVISSSLSKTDTNETTKLGSYDDIYRQPQQIRCNVNFVWIKNKCHGAIKKFRNKIEHIGPHGSVVVNPYVSIRLISPKYFVDATKYRGNVQRNTLSPVFTEKFEFAILRGIDLSNVYVQIVIKDQGSLGHSNFMGEVYLNLEEYIVQDNDHDVYNQPSRNMLLTRPIESDYEITTKALEARNYDSDVSEFLKRERLKM